MNDRFDELRQQYGCGPVQFSGADEALYNRHLLFDDVIDPFRATPREQFEAMARSLRDVISQRWLLTERTYEQRNPKRVYYLSMEFLLGRSLANNAINSQLAEVVLELIRGKSNVDPALIETEPDAGLGNGGLGRLAACFLDSMATMQLPAWATACAMNTASSSRPSRTAGNASSRTIGCGAQTRGRLQRLDEAVEVKLNCSFELRAGELRPDRRPAVDPDRHSLRPAGGRLRRQDHQYASPVGGGRAGLLRLSGIQPRRFRGRACRNAWPPNRSRVSSIPTTPPAWGRDCASCRNISSSPARWPISSGASGAATPIGMRFPRKSPFSSTIRTRRWPFPS